LTRVQVIIFAFRALKLYLALSFLDHPPTLQDCI
jgi:hypothetical protein